MRLIHDLTTLCVCVCRFSEYQRQLWDPLGRAEYPPWGSARLPTHVPRDASVADHHGSFHRYGQVGILTLDVVSAHAEAVDAKHSAQQTKQHTKGATFSRQLQHQAEPSLLSPAQWTMVELALDPSIDVGRENSQHQQAQQSRGGVPSGGIPVFNVLVIVSPLLVLSDIPQSAVAKRRAGAATVQATAVQVPGRHGSRSGCWVQLPDTWACYPRDQVRTSTTTTACICDGCDSVGLTVSSSNHHCSNINKHMHVVAPACCLLDTLWLVQDRLLDLVFRWMAKSPLRNAVFMCNGSYVGGLRSEVQEVQAAPATDGGTTAAAAARRLPGGVGAGCAPPRSIVQVAVGPLTEDGDPLVTENPQSFEDERLTKLRQQRARALLADTACFPGGWATLGAGGRYRFRHHRSADVTAMQIGAGIDGAAAHGHEIGNRDERQQGTTGFVGVGANGGVARYAGWTPNFSAVRVVYDPRAARLAAELLAEQRLQGTVASTSNTGAADDTITTTTVSATQPRAHVLVGPVIGLTTCTSTVVLVEVDNDVSVTVVLTDVYSGNEVSITLQLRAQRPRGFHFTNLEAERE